MVNTLAATFFAAIALMSSTPAALDIPGATDDGATYAADPNYGRPDVAGSPAGLVKAHDCWTNEAPRDMAGKIPGHVIIRYDDEVAAKYRGSKAVVVALDHIFTAPHPHVADVVAFCR